MTILCIESHISLIRGEGSIQKMTSNIFATLFNFNKLHMCGIRNPKIGRDTRATNYLRIIAGGHFLVVMVM